MFISGIFSFIGETAEEIIVGIFLLIDSLVYSLISWLYQIFCVLASFRLFDNNMYESITKSIYVVIGVVALFLIAYQLLFSMVHVDDNKSLGETKKIVVNLITSLVLIALVPTIFDFLYSFQNSILSNNVIGRIILPSFNYDNVNETVLEYVDETGDTQDVPLNEIASNVTEENYNYYLLQYYGNNMSTQLFQAFFYPTDTTVNDFNERSSEIETEGNGTGFLSKVAAYGLCGLAVASSFGVTVLTSFIGSPTIGASLAYCAAAIGIERVGDAIINVTSDKYTLADAYNYVSITGDFSAFQKFSSNIINNEITYHYILSSIVGIVAAYILAIYCIDLGVRTIKLAFYQILAPIPILMRVIPKQDKIFSNWLKATLSTYAEVFIRMIILYFGVFLISNLPTIMSNIFSDGSAPYTNNILIYLLVRAILIIGVLIFIRQMPKILEDITGIKSGNFSLNIKDHLKEAAWAPAAVGGLIAGKGNPLSMIRSGSNAWKNNNLTGIGSEFTRRKNLEEARKNGSTFGGRFIESTRKVLGLQSGVSAMDEKIKLGINPETGNPFEARNDTSNNIILRDANGNVIEMIGVGDTIDMSSQTQEMIATTKQANAIRTSQVDEIIRHIDASASSNSKIISLRSEIKKEAEDKVAEKNSVIEDTITAGGRTFTGNLASMEEYLNRRRLDGADENELKDIVREIGNAKDRMWQEYARRAIAGTINNGKISGLNDQITLAFNSDALQSAAGIAYDRVADTRGLNNLTGIDLINALDRIAKEFNNGLTIDKDTQNNLKATIQEETAGLDRLTAQLTEQQELSKHSNTYRSKKANVDNINNNNKGGNS